MINETQVKRWLNQDENLPSPHNGPCDRADLCRYASQLCRQPLSDYPLDWKDWESTPLPAAPNRRWIDCCGWKITLGMVFDKKSGSWVYPATSKHLEFIPLDSGHGDDLDQ